MRVEVKVPATTANLGPGFDCLGMALSLYNTFIFEKKKTYEFINIEKKYANNSNLVIVSAKEVYDYLKVQEIPFSLEIVQDVPIARGLGSSATCIIAGIIIANYFTKDKLSLKEMLMIATKIEGHPDNVAPALLGGLVASVNLGNEVLYTKYEVNKDLLFVTLIPNIRLSTSVSRKVIPAVQPYENIVFNMSRAINIPNSISEGDVDKLYYLLDDRLHQPYRLGLINDSEVFYNYGKEKKIPFCISGSGSTLLLILDESKRKDIQIDLKKLMTQNSLQNDWKIIELKSDDAGATRKEII